MTALQLPRRGCPTIARWDTRGCPHGAAGNASWGREARVSTQAAHGAGEVRHRGIDRDHQVGMADEGGGIGKVTQFMAEVPEFGSGGEGLLIGRPEIRLKAIFVRHAAISDTSRQNCIVSPKPVRRIGK
jgi:hypothetical protein